ncbi:MAG: hypothetical protein ACE5FI_18795 [Anaerolineales bacterium]
MNQKNQAWPNGMPTVGQRAQRSRAVTVWDIELFTELSGDRVVPPHLHRRVLVLPAVAV